MDQLPVTVSQHPAQATPSDQKLSRIPIWKTRFQETRTRILLIYALLLLLLSGISIPVFRVILFSNVNNRVRETLREEREDFAEALDDWQAAPSQGSHEQDIDVQETGNQETGEQDIENLDDYKVFLDEYFENTRPEDDNFQIALLNGQLYRSNPTFLLEPLRPGSPLFQRWQTTTEAVSAEEKAIDPDIGSIIYKTIPIKLQDGQQGLFVVAHSTAGERQEALVGVYLFSGFTLVAVLLSLLLSWLLAGRLMAPITTLSKTAVAITESDLTQRIPEPSGQNELSALVHTFNAMMDRIQTAFDSQRAFINDAGHELRTPITIIQGHLELMDGDPQERQETMELVMDELDRMGRLVSDLILLAKSERPNFLQLETISVKVFVQKLFTKASALADRRWVLAGEMNDMKEDTGTHTKTIVGDRQKLTGALLNLLRNAAQHTQPTDTIELGYQFTNSGSIHFWVRDTGEGIHPNDQQKIFDRFFRSHQPRKSNGSGLGLSIAQAIAAAHGGHIQLTSQPGQGATFHVILPAAAQTAQAVAVPFSKAL